MNPSTEQLIRELADKLGVSLEQLWNVLIVQARYSAICNLIGMVLCFTLTIFLFKWFIKLLKQRKIEETARLTEKYSNTDHIGNIAELRKFQLQNELSSSILPNRDQAIFFIVLIMFVVFGLTSLAAIPELPNLIMRLLNPEFGAIEILQGLIGVR